MKNEELKKKNFIKKRTKTFIVFCISLFIVHFSLFIVFAENVKEPNVAGAFYPADKNELTSLIHKYLKDAEGITAQGETAQGEPIVLVSPHAGYIYSGPVAAYGFQALYGRVFDTVIVLAPSHYFPFHGVSVYEEGVFRTPEGDLDIDNSMALDLLKIDSKLVISKPEYFEQEHAVEVELPFLQETLKKGFKILPLILGNMSYEECEALAGYLLQIIKEKSVLVVVSTDLSHYRSYEEALDYDAKTINFLKNLDGKGLWDAVEGTGWNVCGIRPVATGIAFAKLIGATQVNILKYANSGDTAGDKRRVVGYVSAIFSKSEDKVPNGSKKDREDDMLTKEDKKKLLEIARATIENHVLGKKNPEFAEKSAGLNLKNGAFVTLNKKGELRGCIGTFVSNEPLYKTVVEMAIASCSQDYRFEPVKEGEIKDIEIEISVLSEPKQIDDWHKIRLGIDGVIIRKGFSSGVFLPQVATETGWDLETFLGQLCYQKAGLPWDSFKDSAAKIDIFQANVFSEKELK